MRKIYMVMVLVICMLSSLAYATDLNDGMVAYWSFDVNADDDFGSNDGTVTDATHLDTGGADGNGYYYLDAQADKICFPNAPEYNFSRTDPFTISLWINSSTRGQSGSIFSKQENSGAYEGYNIIQQDGYVFTYFNDQSGNTITKKIQENKTINGNWQHIIYKYNGTSFQSGIGLYWNGTQYADAETADEMTNVAWNDAVLCIGARDDNTGFGNWVGRIDEIGIWNRNLSDTEIELLYTSFYPFSVPPYFTYIPDNQSLEYNVDPLDVTFNATDDDDDFFGFFLYGDPDNFSITIDGRLTNTTNLPMGTFMLNVTINDTFGNANNTLFYVTVNDTIEPTATYTYPSDDNSTVIMYNTSMSFDWEFNDNNLLWSLNISCTNYSDYISGIDSPSYPYTNSSTFLDNQTCIVTYCDAHTDNDISMSVTTDNIRKTIDFGKTSIVYDTDIKNVNLIKLNDRYSIDISTFTSQSSVDFYMSDTCKYVKNSGYNGHFVCEDRYWVDFEPYDVVVYGNKVTVKINSDKAVFNSIGELNCVTDVIYFEIFRDTTPPTVTSISPENNSLQTSNTIDFTFNVSENSSNCSLYINDTLYESMISVNTSSNIFDGVSLDYATSYEYFINCTDIYSNTGMSDIFYFNTTERSTLTDFELDMMSCDTSTTPKVMLLMGFCFIMVLLWMFMFWVEIPIFSVLFGLILCYFAWNIAMCFFLANMLFISMGMIAILHGISVAMTR